MAKEIAETLRKAKALIDSPEKWMTGDWGKGKGGRLLLHTETVPEDCECLCALGAIARVTGVRLDRSEDTAAAYALGKAIGDCIPSYNDSHEHADIMAMFDRAIATEDASS